MLNIEFACRCFDCIVRLNISQEQTTYQNYVKLLVLGGEREREREGECVCVCACVRAYVLAC